MFLLFKWIKIPRTHHRKDGVKSDEEKIAKVKNFPTPTTVCQIRGFLGLASYYRKFIKGFSKIAKPLNLLLQKDQPYYCGNEQENAFQTPKDHLITAPILQYSDFRQPFYIYTDVSQSGLEAVLAQIDKDKREHVIVYASRSLSKAEQNYSATELECLAVVWAVDHFHQYLGEITFISLPIMQP